MLQDKDISKEDCISIINKITFEEFNNYAKNININALLYWLSTQTEEVVRTTLKLEPYINKLIDKFGAKAGLNINSDRKFLATGMTIKIMKSIYSRGVSYNVVKKIPYKKGLIINNIDIIESIIFEIINAGYKHWEWKQVFYEFFKRIDKQQLRGKDKLKKDPTKIMTIAYFRMIATEHFYKRSKEFEDNLTKSDIAFLVEDTIKKQLVTDKKLEIQLKADNFNSYKR